MGWNKYDLHGMCNTNSQIEFKTTMSSLWDFIDVYIFVKQTISIANTRTAAAVVPAVVTDCLSETNNTQADNIKDIVEIFCNGDVYKYIAIINQTHHDAVAIL